MYWETIFFFSAAYISSHLLVTTQTRSSVFTKKRVNILIQWTTLAGIFQSEALRNIPRSSRYRQVMGSSIQFGEPIPLSSPFRWIERLIQWLIFHFHLLLARHS